MWRAGVIMNWNDTTLHFLTNKCHAAVYLPIDQPQEHFALSAWWIIPGRKSRSVQKMFLFFRYQKQQYCLNIISRKGAQALVATLGSHQHSEESSVLHSVWLTGGMREARLLCSWDLASIHLKIGVSPFKGFRLMTEMVCVDVPDEVQHLG